MPYNNTILLGQDESGSYYEAKGYQHIFLLAPHGAGKGVGFVLPTLLSLEESCIIHDIKLENYELTSGYRESIGHKIFVFNPLSQECKTHRYNPLDFLSDNDDQKITDIQKIADSLFDGSGEAKKLFTGLVLFLIARKLKPTLGRVAQIINMESKLIEEISSHLSYLQSFDHKSCFQILQSFLNKTTRNQNMILRELNEALYLWHNPLIDYATSESDFDISLFKAEKTTLYVGVEPTDIKRLEPLMRLFYNHVFDRLIDYASILNNDKNHHGITLILDDFYTIGRLNNYLFGYLRGYKIRLFMIASDINNIKNIYGEGPAHNILALADFKIFFAPRDLYTAAQIVSLCIDHDIRAYSCQQIMSLPSDLQMMILENAKPVITKKRKYYDEKIFHNRIMRPIIVAK